MTTHAFRLRFALDPLIAEAKLRARRRRVLFVVALVFATAAGAAAMIASSRSPGPAFVPTRPSSAAVQASVADFHQSTQLAPRGPIPYFGVRVSVRNASGKPITLERIRLDLSARSRLRQIGTRWGLFAPEVCTQQMISCQINWALGEPSTTRPYGVERPAPLRVPPGHTAVTQLNFFVPCTSRSHQETVSVQKSSTILYSLPNGTEIHQQAPPRPGHSISHFGAVVGSAAAAKAWTAALPGSPLNGMIGQITTHACHR
jgi:hypothetical protein